MLASLAYFQGAFNTCSFEWTDPTHCKISLHDTKNDITGSFVAQYDKAWDPANPTNRPQIIDISEDTDMATPTELKKIPTPFDPAPSPVVKAISKKAGKK